MNILNSESQGSEAPAGTEANTETPPAGDSQQQASSSFEENDWRSPLVKDAPELSKFLEKYPDVGTMAKNYAQLEKKYRSDNKVAIPGEGATEDDIKAFHKALGVPDLENYELDYEINEGNKPLVDNLKKIAHENGITPSQLKAIFSGYDGQVTELMKAQQAEQAKADQQKAEDFKKELGTKYDETIAQAQYASKNFIEQEKMEHFEKQGYLKDPEFIKLLANVGKGMKEDNVFKGETNKTMGMSPEQARSEAQKLMADPAYFDATNPKHQMVKDRVQKMFEIAG